MGWDTGGVGTGGGGVGVGVGGLATGMGAGWSTCNCTTLGGVGAAGGGGESASAAKAMISSAAAIRKARPNRSGSDVAVIGCKAPGILELHGHATVEGPRRADDGFEVVAAAVGLVDVSLGVVAHAEQVIDVQREDQGLGDAEIDRHGVA